MKSIQSPSTPPLSHSQYSYTPTSSPSRPAAPTSPLIAMIPSLDTESPPPVDDELHQEVDILHRFRNPELQQHYQHFLKRSPKPIKVIFGLNFILTCYFLPISIQYFAHTIRNNTHSWHESADCVLGLSYLLTILLSAVLGWMLLASYRTKCSIVLPVLFKPEANFAIPPSSMPRSNSTNLLDMPISTSSPSEATCKTLQTTPLMYMYVLCLTTSAVLNFIHDALPAHHKHPHFLLLEHSLKGSDHDHMLLLRDCLLMTILPFLFVQFFLDLSLLFHYILVCSIAVLIIAMDVAQDYYIPILYVILWTVAALCIVKDNHFRTLQHFYTTMKLSTASHQDAHQSVAETKETDDLLSRQQQLAIVETKKMIANVAHDLKTVSET